MPLSSGFSRQDHDFGLFRSEMKFLNLFTVQDDGLRYEASVQKRLPLRLPQTLILYTLLFWLGSLVRYDPHSVAWLEETEHWLLIDGFMNQSRIWLLELFEWELYQRETDLQTAR
jgi:hypothetical protein